MKKDRPYFPFYRSFYESASMMSKADKADFYDAIISYSFTGKHPKLSGIASVVFSAIKPIMEQSLSNFQNGKKGGRPPKEKGGLSEKEKGGFEKKKTYNDNDNDNDNESENDKDSDNEKYFLEQKDTILQIFFFNNFEYPEEEVERFYAFYKSKGWEDTSGRKIKDIVSRAKLWKQDEECNARYSSEELNFLEALYNKADTAKAKSIILRTGKIERRIATSSTYVWDIYHSNKSGMTKVLQKYAQKAFLPQNVESLNVV